MRGQEAHDALSVKYGKDGKSAPQYDWTDPTDYGEDGVPTPVIDADGNAGLLREASGIGKSATKVLPKKSF